jgi:uncharacterized membrane protein YagU involved in acid resistance
MNKLVSGIIAGIVATVVLSVMMVLKGKMGVMPELNIIAMLAGMMGASAIIGWIMHFMVGVVYGIAFSQINSLLPGKSLMVKGIMMGILGWLVMMLMLMPMMGASMFAMNMGMMAPVMTLVLHIIFGAVLGLVYKSLQSNS